MKWTIKLPGCRPYSINDAYYKSNFTLTRECRIWRQTIFDGLNGQENQNIINSIKNLYDPKRHGFQLHIRHHIPYEYFFTTDNRISRRGKDITNIEKLLVDCLFEPRYVEKGYVNNLNNDDCTVISCLSQKFPSHEWKIVVHLSLYDITEVREKFRRRNR